MNKKNKRKKQEGEREEGRNRQRGEKGGRKIMSEVSAGSHYTRSSKIAQVVAQVNSLSKRNSW